MNQTVVIGRIDKFGTPCCLFRWQSHRSHLLFVLERESYMIYIYKFDSNTYVLRYMKRRAILPKTILAALFCASKCLFHVKYTISSITPPQRSEEEVCRKRQNAFGIDINRISLHGEISTKLLIPPL
jgi:hypothetical protein